MPALSKPPALFVLAGIAWAALALPISAQLPGPATDPMLAPLLLQEQALLEDFGADHPQVRALRDRIAAVRANLARQAPTPRPAPIAAPVVVQAVHTQPIVPQVPAPAIRRASVPDPVSVPLPVPEFLLHWNREREGDRERKKSLDSREAAGGGVPNAKPQAELLPWVGMSAAFLAGLLVQVAALAIVFRLFGSRWAPPLRIQLVGAAAQQLADQSVPAKQCASPPKSEVESCRVGLLHRKEDVRQQQEDAIFRDILEQNVRLHAQLAKGSDASEKH